MGKDTKTVAPNIDITPQLSDLDIAWLAGLYEGEGHASGHKGRTIAHISQKDPEILYRVRSMLGGRIEQVRVDTPKYCHQWKLYGDRARLFFQTIHPHLSTRRKMQIENANAFKLVGKLQPTREAMTAERRALRANMTPLEKVRESYRAHRERHYERITAYQREYSKRKHAQKILARQQETSLTIQ